MKPIIITISTLAVLAFSQSVRAEDSPFPLLKNAPVSEAEHPDASQSVLKGSKNAEQLDKENPTIRSEFRGLSEDGKKFLITLFEPENVRVKALSGIVSLHDEKGKELWFCQHSFGEYPFESEWMNQPFGSVSITRDYRIDTQKTDLVRALNQPHKLSVRFTPTTLEIEKVPQRIREMTLSREDDATWIDIEMHPGEVVLAAQVRERWGRWWIKPVYGEKFTNIDIREGYQFRAKISSPDSNEDKMWKFFSGHANKNISSLVGWKFAPANQEKLLPVHFVEVPLATDGLQVYLIPYRVIEDFSDALLIAIADNPNKIKEHFRSMPSEKSFDW